LINLKHRWGEGEATVDQIWVQPPGTPTVGMAFLAAWRGTGDAFYLDAATDAASALIHGQLQSGAWTNAVDFDPRGSKVAQYRNGRGRGRNFSTLDDGISPSAIQLLMRVDQAHKFRLASVSESVRVALDALLRAQFANGGFPQGWDEDTIPQQPILPASWPDYDWKTEGRIKNYWDMYTLNDNVAGYVADTLIDAHAIYGDDRYLLALRRLGEFVILAQMPEPQPGWAQQYNYRMQPIWARRFEPAAMSGDESQEVIETLLRIHHVTGDAKFLEPIPAALNWLKRSRLPDGQLARYYELKTNRPLYMRRRGKEYSLTYDDSALPSHYGWKGESRLASIEQTLGALRTGRGSAGRPDPANLDDQKTARADLDPEGRWISRYDGERLVGQPKFAVGAPYISSAVFSRNLTLLSRYLRILE